MHCLHTDKRDSMCRKCAKMCSGIVRTPDLKPEITQFIRTWFENPISAELARLLCMPFQAELCLKGLSLF